MQLERAALCAVAYADVFDYALELSEIHRYLHGVTASAADTARALARVLARGQVCCRDRCYVLPGRETLVALRRARLGHARRLWPAALRWGRRIAGLPFVRMVAVTGALAWNNVDADGDIDYLVVTQPGRVWLARALIAAMGRIARLRGIKLCANYVVSSSALRLAERDVYSAYELAHMTPVAGLATYRRMRRLNRWTDDFLPNAVVAPPRLMARRAAPPARLRQAARFAERTLAGTVGELLERREMARCTRRRLGRARVPGEAVYDRDCYKDHLGGHRDHALLAFSRRLQALGVEPE